MITSPHVVKDANGEQYIPASQRADGTWRKARKVKDGYVPQDEVPLYQSKGKQWAASKNAAYPVGLDPALIKEKDAREAAAAEKLRKQNAAKKKAAQPAAQTSLSQPKSSQGSSTPANLKPSASKEVPRPPKEVPKQKPSVPKNEPHKAAESSSEPVDVAKRLRNLKKKLKEIEALEAKINSNELKNPDKDQLDKVRRKKTIEDDILALTMSSTMKI